MPTPHPKVTQTVIRTMERHGGSFVQKLADLWTVCDQENRAVLEHAYSDVFARYCAMAERVTP